MPLLGMTPSEPNARLWPNDPSGVANQWGSPMVSELPAPRGELSAWLIERLREPALLLDDPPLVEPADPLIDDDFQLSLYVLYELHYRGFRGVDQDWEWEPGLLRVRAGLERTFEAAVRAVAGPVETA